jgi:uncharacterized protein YkwD
LPALKLDAKLQKLAQDRAKDRFENNTCEHGE